MTLNRLPAVALLAGAILLTGACGGGADAPTDTSPAPAPAPSTSTTAATEVVDYGEEGVQLKTVEDVAKLHDAPADFTQFIAGAAGRVITPKSKTDKCGPYLYVNKVDPSGYAVGGVFECGGAELIWAKRGGVWQEIWGGQTIPECADMEKYSVPKAIAGDQCWDGKKETAYTG